MKNFFLLSVILLVISGTTVAQPRTVSTTVEYQNKKHAAAMLDLPYPVSILEDAIEGYLSQRGSVGTSVKGFKLYRNVELATIDSNEKVVRDLYINVEKQKKQKKMGTIYALVSKPNEVLLNKDVATVDDNDGIEAAKKFLDNMVPYFDECNLAHEIKMQEEELAKSGKKLDKLKDDGRDLEKRKADIENDIKKNVSDVKQQAETLEKGRAVLESLKGKSKKA